MKRLVVARLLFASAAVCAGVPLLPVTSSAAAPRQVTVTVADTMESWYSINPVSTCGSGVGCLPTSVTVSPYPQHTLHVGITGGQPVAVTYVLPSLSGVPANLDISGNMTLPVLDENGAGTANAASASPVGCLVTAPVKDGVQGSTDKPPAYDCSVTSPLKYDAAGGQFRLDITPFLQAWRAGKPADGIAIVPDPKRRMPTESWSVAVNDRKRGAAATHIRSALHYVAEPAPRPTASTSTSPAPPSPGGSSTGTGSSTSNIPLPTAPADTSGAPSPVIAPAPSGSPVAAQPVGFVSGRFQYPIVFVVPLLLVAGGAFLARLFTADARPLWLRS